MRLKLLLWCDCRPNLTPWKIRSVRQECSYVPQRKFNVYNVLMAFEVSVI